MVITHGVDWDCMDASDAHLERTLADCNDTVGRLEPYGPSEDLLEAYVNRAEVLAMMEYRTSALDDTESAIDIVKALSSNGYEPDAGTMFKVHITRAILMYEQECDPIEEYAAAAEHIGRLDAGSRHHNHRSFVRSCLTACADLLDYDHAEDTSPYREAMHRTTVGSSDAWTLNRRLEMANLEGEAFEAMDIPEAAANAYAEGVRIGTELLSMGALEDEEELISSMIAKANWEQVLGRMDTALVDLKSACIIMEQMLETHRLDDIGYLTDAYRDIAAILSSKGEDAEAESYLVKAMRANMRLQDDIE